MTTQNIQITSHLDGRTHDAIFEPVRSAKYLTLGWATVQTEDVSLRFPAILAKTNTVKGYAVYTVSDWQAPESSFGDLSDALEWALLCRTGTGRFTNPRLEYGSPINVSLLSLPMDDEQKAEFKRLAG